MTSLQRFLATGIGQKFVMALMAIGLVLFLLVHMAGNLLAFAGADAYNKYSHLLITNPLIYLAELMILAAFLLHLIPGVLLTQKNLAARGSEPYRGKGSAGYVSRRSLFSRTMIITGLVLLVFVPFHLWKFKYGAHYTSVSNPKMRDLYRLMIEVFKQPLWTVMYVAFMALIGFHLWHGLSSAAESLGFRHRVGMKRFGRTLAVVITVGFSIVPLYILLAK